MTEVWQVAGRLPLLRSALLRSFLRLSTSEKVVALGHWMRGREARVSRPPKQVLFVCHGNVARSAFAAGLLRLKLAESGCMVDVRSAGTDVRAARADPRAIEIAAEFGVDLSDHHPAAIDSDSIRTAEMVLGLDLANCARVARGFPDQSGRVVLLGEAARVKRGARQVPDPHAGDLDEYRSCFYRIDGMVSSLADRLNILSSAPTSIREGSVAPPAKDFE
jgi:protein-tyrosine-phosphatase